MANPAHGEGSGGGVPKGLRFGDKAELVAYLAAWLGRSSGDRLGDVGNFGGKVWITVDSAAGPIGINSDTRREAVEALVEAARARPGSGWRVVANRRGRINRVLFSGEATPGWYAYLAEPLDRETVLDEVSRTAEPDGTSEPDEPDEPDGPPAGGRTLAIVQFPHPGGEHVPAGREMSWNLGPHARKYLVAPGRALDAAGDEHDGELVFWGEWEPPSQVVRRWTKRPGLPTVVHRPFWSSSPIDGAPPRQNTDPWVFGGAFLYSNCRQLTPAPNRRPSALQDLAPGSLVLFGSTVGGGYVVDTVFVVGRVLGEYTPAERRRPAGGDEAFEECTVESLRSLAPAYAGASFTLYEGATPARPVDGMFSFVPCRPSAGRTARFARPVVRLPGIVNPRSTQSASGAGRSRPTDEVVDSWHDVVVQVLQHDLLLGVRFATPPALSTPPAL